MPQCGFSMQVAQILDHLGVDFKDINVLENMSVRDGIKAYSNWPTIPQLYVKGEFIGGCDIVREMFQAGRIAGASRRQGHRPQRADADSLASRSALTLRRREAPSRRPGPESSCLETPPSAAPQHEGA